VDPKSKKKKTSKKKKKGNVKGAKGEKGEKQRKPKAKAKSQQSSASSAGQPTAGAPEPKAANAKRDLCQSLMAPVKWPDELKDVLGSSPKKGCGSFTMTGPDGGKVEVNKRGHFYVTTPDVSTKRMINWKVFGGIRPGI
jgi:hypothetical protein